MRDDNAQFDMFPTRLDLQRIDPGRNMRRFYRLIVQRDLFGQASLVRVWGRIGSGGRQRIETHEDEGKAISALMAIAQAKRKRGYRI